MRLAILPIVLMFILPAAAVADTVTAEWGLDANLNSYASFGANAAVTGRGQSFVAVTSGRLTTVELRVERISDHDVPLRVAIHAADGAGLPSGPALASRDFEASLIPLTTGPVTLDFGDADAMLEAGTSYAIALRSGDTEVEGSLYALNLAYNEAATYAGGVAFRALGDDPWLVSDLFDAGFRVLVDTSVPVERVSWGALKRDAAPTRSPAGR